MQALSAERQEEFIALYTRLLDDLDEDEAVYFASSWDIAALYSIGLRTQRIPNKRQSPPSIGSSKGLTH